jgi:hypothetical protein
VLDLDAPELGIRPEDRFAAIPPGPRLIPRRHHDESSRAPFVLLAGLVAFFVIGAWLGGAGSDDDDGPDTRDAPASPLAQATGTRLVLLGGESVAVFDVDEAAVTPVETSGFDALASAIAAHPVTVRPGSPGQIWVATAEQDGASSAHQLDLADGSPTAADVVVEGHVIGALSAAVVVERAGGGLDIVDGSGTTIRELGTGRAFLAAGGAVLATRSRDCTGAECEVVVDDFATGVTYRLRTGLGASGGELATVSPDGRRLAVVRSDGVETHGALVDLRLDTVIPFEARATLRRSTGAPTLAWSPDGSWLFVATTRGGLDAVASDGQTYRVEAELPPFAAIVTR